MIAEQLRKIIESGHFEELRDLYAADALLDVNVPSWRFQRQGPEAILEQFKQWYPLGPPRVTAWRERPCGADSTIEAEEVEGQGAEATYARTVHLLRLEQNRIAEHVMYCTGRWDVATVERHKAEAPMVHW